MEALFRELIKLRHFQVSRASTYRRRMIPPTKPSSFMPGGVAIGFRAQRTALRELA
jgi:hypothetical protein